MLRATDLDEGCQNHRERCYHLDGYITKSKNGSKITDRVPYLNTSCWETSVELQPRFASPRWTWWAIEGHGVVG